MHSYMGVVKIFNYITTMLVLLNYMVVSVDMSVSIN